MLKNVTRAFAAAADYVSRLGRGVTKAAVSPLSLRDVWGPVREAFAGAWQKNVVVDNRECVLAFAAVYACVTRIANDIAKLRIKLVEQDSDGIWTEVARSSPYLGVLVKPNRYQNRIQFLADWLLMKLLFGNTYVLKQRDQRGIVVAMYVLDSRRVKPLVTPDGGVYYQLSSDYLAGLPSGATVPASEIIHDRGPTLFHTLCGVSPIFACGASATQGNRIQANSAKFFENMSRPSGHLTAPGTIDEATANRLKADFEANFGGGNIGRLLVTGDDLKYEPMTIPAEDAQLIEQLKWTVEDVARAFAMPLYKIGAGPVPTSNNVEALHGQYYTDCLQVYIEAIELALDEGLGLTNVDGRVYGTELDLDGLLRMDSATQFEVLAKGVSGALIMPNEARKRLNLPPVKGGNQLFLQEQNYSLEALAKRDSKPDPWAKEMPAAASLPAPSAAPSPAPAPAPTEQARGADELLMRLAEEARQAAIDAAARAAEAVLESVRGASAEVVAAAEQRAAAAEQARDAAAEQLQRQTDAVAAREVEHAAALARAAAAESAAEQQRAALEAAEARAAADRARAEASEAEVKQAVAAQAAATENQRAAAAEAEAAAAAAQAAAVDAGSQKELAEAAQAQARAAAAEADSQRARAEAAEAEAARARELAAEVAPPAAVDVDEVAALFAKHVIAGLEQLEPIDG